MAFKRVSVINEDSSGRNLAFRDNVTGEELSRAQFVRKIEQGEYDHRYHVRVVHGVKTPASNPDSSENNNLG
ncbi:MAG: DUF3892 domain-containing protein [Thermoanaerobaculia bacterium]